MSQPLLFLTKHCCNAMKIGFHFVRWPSLTRFTVFLCVQEWFLWTNSLYFGLIFQCLRKLWKHYRPKDWQNFWNCRPCKSIAGLYGSNLWCFYASAFRRRRHHVFGLSVRPSVRPSVCPKPEIPSFDLYMGPLVHLTNLSVRRGFQAFAGERMKGMAWNFTCWCVLTIFRTD